MADEKGDDVPLECVVSGRAYTNDGNPAAWQDSQVRLTRTRKGWMQTNIHECARHLRREYVCFETLECLTHDWLPHDFSEFYVSVEKCGPNPFVKKIASKDPVLSEQDSDTDAAVDSD